MAHDPRTLGANVRRSFLSLPWVLGSNLWCEPLARILQARVAGGAFVPDQWVASARFLPNGVAIYLFAEWPMAVQEQSIPVVDYYEGQGKVKRISAVPPPDEVFLKVQQVLDGLQVTSLIWLRII